MTPQNGGRKSTTFASDISALTKEYEQASAIAEKYKGTFAIEQYGAASEKAAQLKQELQALRVQEEALGMAQLRKAQAIQVATTEQGKAIAQNREEMVQQQALAQQMQLENQNFKCSKRMHSLR